MVRYIGEDEIRTALDWDALIDAMEAALAAFSSGAVDQPVRNLMTIETGKRYFGIMPVIARESMGAKLVSFYPGNAGGAHPTHMAMIMLFRPETGEPLAALDGRLITEMRTAAVSAAVTRKVAPTGARVLALLGAGVQAEAHLEAIRRVRAIEDVRVWSRTPESAQNFAAKHGARAMTAEEAVRGADIVVTVTSSSTPVLKGAWLKPGAHVNAVGACLPTWRELDDGVMANPLIVDSRAAAIKESGDVILSKAAIFAEAGELFAGAAPPPKGVTTVFKSLGLAVEDIAAAKLVYDALEGRAG